MRKNDCHNAACTKVVKIVQKECVICFRFRCDTVTHKSRIVFLTRRIPFLRIRRVADYRIEICERLVGIIFVVIVKIRPIVFQRVAATSNDIVGQNTAHNQVHTSKVISIFLQFLSVIFDFILVVDMLCNALTDID